MVLTHAAFAGGDPCLDDFGAGRRSLVREEGSRGTGRDDAEVLIEEDDLHDQRPSVETQDSHWSSFILTHGKGKLRNIDLMPVYGVCKVDPSADMRQCFIGKLPVAWNDKSYVPAQTRSTISAPMLREPKL